MTNPMTSEEEKNLIDEVCDGLIERLGVEPDGHNTWAKTTDEIVKEVREEIEGKVDALLQSQKEKVVEVIDKEISNLLLFDRQADALRRVKDRLLFTLQSKTDGKRGDL